MYKKKTAQKSDMEMPPAQSSAHTGWAPHTSGCPAWIYVQCSLEHSKESSLMPDYVEVKTHHCQATLEAYRDIPSQNLNFVLILWKS